MIYSKLKLLKNILAVLFIVLLCNSCGIYSFSGISISPEIKTFEVEKFRSTSGIIEAGLDRRFTTELQDYILNQTNLNLVTNNGDIIYDGEIIDFYIAPNNATDTNNTAENRLTIKIKVRFTDLKNSKNNLEKIFSHFYDYPSADQLIGAVADVAYQEIFERIKQDIVNATLAKW